jgi:hypothetical protein
VGKTFSPEAEAADFLSIPPSSGSSRLQKHIADGTDLNEWVVTSEQHKGCPSDHSTSAIAAPRAKPAALTITNTADSNKIAYQIYEAAEDETLKQIAVKVGIPVEELRELNKIRFPGLRKSSHLMGGTAVLLPLTGVAVQHAVELQHTMDMEAEKAALDEKPGAMHATKKKRRASPEQEQEQRPKATLEMVTTTTNTEGKDTHVNDLVNLETITPIASKVALGQQQHGPHQLDGALTNCAQALPTSPNSAPMDAASAALIAELMQNDRGLRNRGRLRSNSISSENSQHGLPRSRSRRSSSTSSALGIDQSSQHNTSISPDDSSRKRPRVENVSDDNGLVVKNTEGKGLGLYTTHGIARGMQIGEAYPGVKISFTDFAKKKNRFRRTKEGSKMTFDEVDAFMSEYVMELVPPEQVTNPFSGEKVEGTEVPGTGILLDPTDSNGQLLPAFAAKTLVTRINEPFEHERSNADYKKIYNDEDADEDAPAIGIGVFAKRFIRGGSEIMVDYGSYYDRMLYANDEEEGIDANTPRVSPKAKAITLTSSSSDAVKEFTTRGNAAHFLGVAPKTLRRYVNTETALKGWIVSDNLTADDSEEEQEEEFEEEFNELLVTVRSPINFVLEPKLAANGKHAVELGVDVDTVISEGVHVTIDSRGISFEEDSDDPTEDELEDVFGDVENSIGAAKKAVGPGRKHSDPSSRPTRPRPRGRAPNEKAWDKVRGVWTDAPESVDLGLNGACKGSEINVFVPGDSDDEEEESSSEDEEPDDANSDAMSDTGDGNDGGVFISPVSEPRRSPRTHTHPQEYVVEQLVTHRVTNKGVLQYKVRWQGYASDEDTWEDLAELTHCDRLLKNYSHEGTDGTDNDEEDSADEDDAIVDVNQQLNDSCIPIDTGVSPTTASLPQFVDDWSVDDVVSWACANSFAVDPVQLKDQDIDGNALLSLNYGMLATDDLYVPLKVDRAKILVSIHKLPQKMVVDDRGSLV